eukprot:TRINITY_DN2725_c2_g2_i1.p1 TRINITY_DN2725_c2_g2~~TRINITY_DN2725_c2_g2_i1.p1  ORF type:complete len:359 (+),score=29.06 TRINITY_DN2725_c2_g2_i1:120-1196(+)
MYTKYWRTYAVAVIGIASYGAVQMLRPSLLIVGDVTVDVVEGKKVPGGAVSYSAAVAHGYGIKAHVVTAGGTDADYSVFDGHHLRLISTEETLTFEHTYTWWGQHRKLRVTAQPNVTLSKSDVPWNWRCARTILLGPLIPNDVDASSFTQQNWLEKLLCPGQRICLMAQGYQRSLDQSGRVSPLAQPSQQLLSGLARNVSVFLSDVETDSWEATTIENISQSCESLLITKGADGASLYQGGNESHIDVVQVDTVDTNGAGDTFATAYMIALLEGSLHPGQQAALAASHTVMLPQRCKPKCVSDGIQLMLQNQSRGQSREPIAIKMNFVLDSIKSIIFNSFVQLQPKTPGKDVNLDREN